MIFTDFDFGILDFLASFYFIFHFRFYFLFLVIYYLITGPFWLQYFLIELIGYPV